MSSLSDAGWARDKPVIEEEHAEEEKSGEKKKKEQYFYVAKTAKDASANRAPNRATAREAR